MSDIARIHAEPTPMACAPRPRVPVSACADGPPDRVTIEPQGALPGWSPDSVHAVPSQRRPGLLPGIFDAIRGVTESGEGQPLTSVQISAMAPFLSQAYEIPVEQVRTGLESVRFYLGGPAAHRPSYAVTLGHDIYVQSAEALKDILSWGSRRWLAHECGHVMQTERTPTSLDEGCRMRRNMVTYGVHFLVDDKLGPGAVFRGLAHWANENFNPWNHDKTHIPLEEAIHDVHVMEREAEKHGVAFAQATAGSATRSPH